MAFPTNPSNGDITTQFGRTYVYNSSNGSWQAYIPTPPSDSIPRSRAVYNTSELPLVNNTIGDIAIIEDDSSLWVWTGSGWFKASVV